MARRRKRRKNIEPIAWVGLVALGAGAVAGGVYVYRRRKASYGRLPTPPVGPVEPTEPSEPTTPNWPVELSSPYAQVTISYSENYTAPYRVWVSIPSQGVSHETGFLSESSAGTYSQRVLWYFGHPISDDDIFVTATNVYIDPDNESRGAIWQSVTVGRFYYTFVAPGSAGRGAWYSSSDQAMAALQNEIQGH